MIPGECFSKKGSNCISAVMTKIFICDESRIHHYSPSVIGNDFTDDYDRIAHNVAAVSLRAFGVPQPAINILLKTMETMRFFLWTGYGELKICMAARMKSALQDMGKEMPHQDQVSLP
jgi:hypothetical protein